MSLAASNPQADVAADARSLAAEGLSRGASRTAIVESGAIALDPGAPANAHDGTCACPGNLMSPPFAPAPQEFGRWLAPFDVAIVTEVETPLAGDEGWRQGGPGWRCRWRGLRSDPAGWAPVLDGWRRLHELTMWLERECMRRGYYLAVGFGAGDCELCEVCDTERLCVEPYAARPSMEAVGIDVGRTREAAGWEALPPARIALTSVVLMV